MKRSVSLHIDTSGSDEITVALAMGKYMFEKKSQSRQMKAQMVLPLVESLLKEHSVSLDDITDITVNTGPGSYTGLRVGISVANTLGWLLGIPVNHGALATPTYTKYTTSDTHR